MESTIATTVTAVKAIKTIGEGLLAAHISSRVKKDVGDILESVSAIQSALYQASAEMLSLQDENEKLKKAAVDAEAWEKRLTQYKLVETIGGAHVYECENAPKHYVCPSCIEQKSIQILQKGETTKGSYSCPSCKTNYPVKPPKAVTPQPIHGMY